MTTKAQLSELSAAVMRAEATLNAARTSAERKRLRVELDAASQKFRQARAAAKREGIDV
jgi:hypothetical protein